MNLECDSDGALRATSRPRTCPGAVEAAGGIVGPNVATVSGYSSPEPVAFWLRGLDLNELFARELVRNNPMAVHEAICSAKEKANGR